MSDPAVSWRRVRRAVTIVVIVVVALAGSVVAHDIYRWWAADALGEGGGYLCERDDGSLWRDPSMGCGYWEDPRCRDGRPCASSRIVTDGVADTGSWLLWTERGLTGPDPPTGVR